MESRKTRSLRFFSWIPVILWVWMGSQGTAFSTELPSLSDVSLPSPKVEKSPGKLWGRDPFLGPPRISAEPAEATDRGESPESGSLSLNAVIARDGEGLAIINNEILRVGDRIRDKRVVEIRRDRVILQDAAGTMELKVDPPGKGK